MYVSLSICIFVYMYRERARERYIHAYPQPQLEPRTTSLEQCKTNRLAKSEFRRFSYLRVQSLV